MSLLATNISKLYGTQKALDSVSFEVKPGEIVGFLGPNGAGKTTMMRILTCYIPPSSGVAKICGFDVAEESIEARKKVGYLPENNPLYTEMYVKEYLNFIAGVHGLSSVSKRVKKAIEITGLNPEKNKKIGALSKGYRQRVGLARALIHDPEVLILDEPTSGLDPNQIVEIRNLIKEAGREKTVLLSTHIMQEVEAICDRVIIINNGKIAADSPTRELHSAVKSKTVITVEFDKVIHESDLIKIPGVASVKKISGNTWRISGNSEKDLRPVIFQFAVQKETAVLTIHKESSSLEEIFRAVTREKK
ncbi:MAG: gliding motility-associated ABC transporter ATP-binding subunit GldA [Bacteroidetes bacterium]|nr:gliding motility-associated ABC transporter ATP-binding subunit GldA [Bacteroidota bacterium]